MLPGKQRSAFRINSRWMPSSWLLWQPQLDLGGTAPPAPPNHAADVTRASGSRVVVGGSPESCFRVNAGHWAPAAGEGVVVKPSRSGPGREQAGSREAATAVAWRAEAKPEEPPPPGPRGECSPAAGPRAGGPRRALPKEALRVGSQAWDPGRTGH